MIAKETKNRLVNVFMVLAVAYFLYAILNLAVGCTATQRAEVKAAAADVANAVDAACVMVGAVSVVTDEVKVAQKLCTERTAPPWRILEAVANCNIEASP